jgi:hypothetical protein
MADGSKKDPTSDFIAVSEEMRKFTQASVEQARNAFNDFLEATTKAMGDAESKGQAFQKEARKLSMGSVEYAQNSLEASFSFAGRMAQAKDVNETAGIAEVLSGRAVQGGTVGNAACFGHGLEDGGRSDSR